MRLRVFTSVSLLLAYTATDIWAGAGRPSKHPSAPVSQPTPTTTPAPSQPQPTPPVQPARPPSPTSPANPVPATTLPPPTEEQPEGNKTWSYYMWGAVAAGAAVLGLMKLVTYAHGKLQEYAKEQEALRKQRPWTPDVMTEAKQRLLKKVKRWIDIANMSSEQKLGHVTLLEERIADNFKGIYHLDPGSPNFKNLFQTELKTVHTNLNKLFSQHPHILKDDTTKKEISDLHDALKAYDHHYNLGDQVKLEDFNKHFAKKEVGAKSNSSNVNIEGEEKKQPPWKSEVMTPAEKALSDKVTRWVDIANMSSAKKLKATTLLERHIADNFKDIYDLDPSSPNFKDQFQVKLQLLHTNLNQFFSQHPALLNETTTKTAIYTLHNALAVYDRHYNLGGQVKLEDFTKRFAENEVREKAKSDKINIEKEEGKQYLKKLTSFNKALSEWKQYLNSLTLSDKAAKERVISFESDLAKGLPELTQEKLIELMEKKTETLPHWCIIETQEAMAKLAQEAHKIKFGDNPPHPIDFSQRGLGYHQEFLSRTIRESNEYKALKAELKENHTILINLTKDLCQGKPDALSKAITQINLISDVDLKKTKKEEIIAKIHKFVPIADKQIYDYANQHLELKWPLSDKKYKGEGGVPQPKDKKKIETSNQSKDKTKDSSQWAPELHEQFSQFHSKRWYQQLTEPKALDQEKLKQFHEDFKASVGQHLKAEYTKYINQKESKPLTEQEFKEKFGMSLDKHKAFHENIALLLKDKIKLPPEPDLFKPEHHYAAYHEEHLNKLQEISAKEK